VLSGYLITSILAREYNRRGRFDLYRFYAGRVRRLFPALCGLLVVLTVYLFVAVPPLDPVMELVPSALYVMNWVRAFEIHDSVLTGHTWSLAIEQQYYLLWPLAFGVALAGKHGSQRVIVGLAALIALALVWRWQIATWRNIDASAARIMYGFDTHADGLLVGGLIAVVSRPVRHLLAFGWLLALVYLLWVVAVPAGNSVALSIGGYTLTACASGILVAKIVTDQDGLLVRALEARLLVLMGMVSYGFYLWHYPVVQIVLYGNIDAIGAFFGSLAYPRISMVLATF
jgi:peptidoglycan/LPS O-acetylase OafA/YrhL